MFRDTSTWLLIFLILGTLVNTAIRWRKTAKTAESSIRIELGLYLIALLIQIMILAFNYNEKNKLNDERLKIRNELNILKTYTDSNIEEPEVKNAIASLISGNELNARFSIQSASKANKNLYPLLYTNAVRYKQNGDYSMANNYFTLCTYLNDKDPHVIFNIAILEQIFYGNKKRDEIISLLEKAIDINSSMIEAYIELGNIYVNSGYFSKAEENFKKALKLDDSDAKARENLAFLYFSNSKYKEAITQFEKLIELNPYEADYHYNLSYCYYNTGFLEKAKISIDNAIKADPDNSLFLIFKAELINDPDYQKLVSDISSEEKTSQESLVASSFLNSAIIDDSLNVIDNEKIETNVNSKKADKESMGIQVSKKYSRIRLTIFNASRNKNAANELGYLLREEYGVRFAVISSRRKYSRTVIYYNNSNDRAVAEEFARRLPGVQKFGPLPKTISITKYKDIVIYLGNDCANVSQYAKKASK